MASPFSICAACRRALATATRRSLSSSQASTPLFRASISTRNAATYANAWKARPAPREITAQYARWPRRRTLATSADPRDSSTTAILNPRQDEEGKLMEINITPRAAKRLQDIMKKDSNPNLCLRVQVESGGCHGFQYLMSLIDMSKVSQEEDTIFESGYGAQDAPQTAKVVMDEPSLELLKGSKVDYTMELIGSQFKIVDNPLATSSCGCGTSFDIKA